MKPTTQWLDTALDGVDTPQANRVRAFRLLLHGGSRLRGLLDRVLAPSGVTAQQGALLSWIHAQPAPPTLTEVARGLGMTHQNVKQIVLALQRKGFLDLQVDTQDRRVRRLQLTARHHAFWQQRNPDDFAAVQTWLAAWTDDDVEQVLQLLLRLHRHLDQQEPRVPPGG